MTAVVRKAAERIVREARLVEVLRQAGIVLTKVGLNETFGVTAGFRPGVATTEGIVAVPGAVELEFDGVELTLGLGITKIFCGKRNDLTVQVRIARCVQGHDGVFTRIEDHVLVEARKGRRTTGNTLFGAICEDSSIDRDVFGVGQQTTAGVAQAEANFPDEVLIPNDPLFLFSSLEILRNQIVRRSNGTVTGNVTELARRIRRQINRATSLIAGIVRYLISKDREVIGIEPFQFIAFTNVEFGTCGAERSVAGERQVIGAVGAEHASVTAHVISETDTRLIVFIEIHDLLAIWTHHLEVVPAHADIQGEGVSNVPLILDVECAVGGVE